MGRPKKSDDPAAGHNSGEPLSDEETAALSQYFALKIRAQERVAAEAKATYDGERTEVNSLYALVKGELRYSRKEFEEVLRLQDMTEAEFLHHEGKRHSRLAAGGLPVGTQMELPLGDTIDDKNEAYQNGYRAGRRADDPVVPSNIAGILRADWEHGWADGQAANAAQLGVAETVLKGRSTPKADEKPVDLKEEVDLEPETIAKKARKVKASSFMDRGTPGPAELSPEAA